ncbi:putative ribonuclease H-like domain-containing protein, partial [Tanacetum coccineum]
MSSSSFLGAVKFEKVKQEKDAIDFKIEKFDKASKDLDQLLGSQITDKSKKGFGYSAVPPPHPLIYNRPNKLDLSYSGLDEFKEPEFKGYGLENSKKESNVVCEKESDNSKENSDKSLVSDDEEQYESITKPEKKTVTPTATKIEKPVKKLVRYAEMYRSQRPRGNQRNWNGQKSNQLGSEFVMYNKACFNCGSFKHVQKNCTYHQKKKVVSGNNYNRVDNYYYAKTSHHRTHKNVTPRAVLLRTGLKPLSTAKPRIVNTARSYRTPVNTVRPRVVNTARQNRTSVNAARANGASRQHDDKGFVDVMLRLMTGNLDYLSFQVTLMESMLHLEELPTTFWAEAVSTDCYVQNRVLVVKPHNKTPYELFRGFKPSLSFMRPFGCHVTILNTLDSLSKFDDKSDECFFVGYSFSSKAFRIYNTRTKRVEENLHIGFLENKPMIDGTGLKWLFDIDSLTQSMNYVPVTPGTVSNNSTENVDNGEPKTADDAQKQDEDVNTASPDVNIGSPELNVVGPSVSTASPNEEDITEEEPEVDLGNITNSYIVPTTPNTRIHKDHPIDNVIGEVQSTVQTRRMLKPTFEQGFLSDVYEQKTHDTLNTYLYAYFLSQIELASIAKALSDSSWVEAMQEELLQLKLQQVWILVDLPNGKLAFGTKWVFRNKKDEKGIVIRNKARLVALGHRHRRRRHHTSLDHAGKTTDILFNLIRLFGKHPPAQQSQLLKALVFVGHHFHECFPRNVISNIVTTVLKWEFHHVKAFPSKGVAIANLDSGKGTLKTINLDFEDVFFLTTKDKTSEILKRFIKEIENLVDKKVEIIRSDNGTEFKNKVMDDFCREKEAVSIACYVQNRVLVVKPHNKTLYELFRGFKPALSFMRPFGYHVTILNTLDSLGKFDGKSDEGFFVGYSLSSKAFRVYNTRTKRVEENLHIGFLENKSMIEGIGLKWLFDINSLTHPMNYVPVTAGTVSNNSTGTSEENSQECIVMPIWKDTSYFDSPTENIDNGEPKTADDAQKQDEDGLNNENAEQERFSNNSSSKDVNAVGQQVNIASPNVNTGSLKLNVVGPSVSTASPNEEDSTGEEPEVNLGNIKNFYIVPTTSNTRIHKDHPIDNVIGEVQSTVQTRRMLKSTSEQRFLSDVYEQKTHDTLNTCLYACFLSQIEPTSIAKALSDSSWVEKAIGRKWFFRNKKGKRGIVIRNKERLVAHGHRQEEGIDYGEVFAPVVRIKAIRLFLAYASFMGFLVYQMDVKSAFLYETIEEEVYVTQPPRFKDPDHSDKVYKVVKALYRLHQATRAWYETLANYLLRNRFNRGKIDQTLFIKKQKGDILLVRVYVDDIIFGSTNMELWLEVLQKEDGIFISQDKYVAKILKKFNYSDVKSASTPVDLEKPLVKDGDADDVDVHLYRSMIGSLMYLTASRPDIMFAVCACARFQVTPKTSHLLAVKRIFRYLKGKPTLGLWYSRDSPFELVDYTDSEYAGATLDSKSTIRGCQFLRKRLISWQCKKQTVVATSTTKAEYVAAASCCGQVGDEAVHKELGDRMERAATTASSLEAEQDSVIHMMVENKYPLSQDILSKMLSRKLEVDNQSDMDYELIRIISLRRGIKPRNPQHVTKNCKTCGSNVHTTSDHNDIELFRKREALQAKKVESLKASKIESSSALRSKTPTKRNAMGAYYLPHSSEYVAPPSIDVVRKEATKYGSFKRTTISKTDHSKKRKESSSTMDSNPSQPPVSTPVDTEMHKKDQQATGGPTSLGVTSEARSNPQL